MTEHQARPAAPAAAPDDPAADPVRQAMADLFDPARRGDPYTPAAVLREAAAVHHTPLGLHLLTRYQECAAVLQGSTWSHAEEAGQLHPSVAAEEAAEELPTSFLWMDPPDHTRL